MKEKNRLREKRKMRRSILEPLSRNKAILEKIQ
jgi:hypothetical protein